MGTANVIIFQKGHDIAVESDTALDVAHLVPLEDEVKEPLLVREMSSYKTNLEYKYRVLPMHYFSVKDALAKEKITVKFRDENKLSFRTKLKVTPRDYQAQAHKMWVGNDMRGVVVLPTGTGKTIQALIAIDYLCENTLVVVPTIDLIKQWKMSVVENLGVREDDIGVFGGGEHEIKAITIITYASAQKYISALAVRFDLVIFDEVHHLPSEVYRTIAMGLIARHRLGLSATPERADELHLDLDDLIGPVVFRKEHEDVSSYIANFKLEKISVKLSDEEKERYDENMKIFRNFLISRRIRFTGPRSYSRIVMMSGRSKAAYDALIAHNEARKIALNADAKIKVVLELLEKHRKDKVIIFSEYISIVEIISKKYLIALITSKTGRKERETILSHFRDGTYTKIASGKVLDEGIDVADASVGIIISGTGSKREYIQRLGRILRPKKDTAVLYELVSEKTLETKAASRRKLKRKGEDK
ncbi:MAG: ATP-dependent helicase [Candidatus Nanohalarchaeota archaeon]|nr:MAG: ATP-dependent helicase [Candidatus Nanohaloarchaeota archaeon]